MPRTLLKSEEKNFEVTLRKPKKSRPKKGGAPPKAEAAHRRRPKSDAHASYHAQRTDDRGLTPEESTVRHPRPRQKPTTPTDLDRSHQIRRPLNLTPTSEVKKNGPCEEEEDPQPRAETLDEETTRDPPSMPLRRACKTRRRRQEPADGA